MVQQRNPARPRYLLITLYQAGVLAALIPAIYLIAGRDAVTATVAGAMCAMLPQAYFAVRVERAAAEGAQRAARSALAAEGGKFFLSAVCFALVFAVVQPARPALVFVGFVLLLVVQVIIGARLMTTHSQGSHVKRQMAEKQGAERHQE